MRWTQWLVESAQQESSKTLLSPKTCCGRRKNRRNQIRRSQKRRRRSKRRCWTFVRRSESCFGDSNTRHCCGILLVESMSPPLLITFFKNDFDRIFVQETVSLILLITIAEKFLKWGGGILLTQILLTQICYTNATQNSFLDRNRISHVALSSF